jgi:hypothetical protein
MGVTRNVFQISTGTLIRFKLNRRQVGLDFHLLQEDDFVKIGLQEVKIRRNLTMTGRCAAKAGKHTVSLPQACFQEIKCMVIKHSTHGLFLTCIQKSRLYLHNVQSFINQPLIERSKDPQLTWKANVLLTVANPHLLWSLAW